MNFGGIGLQPGGYGASSGGLVTLPIGNANSDLTSDLEAGTQKGFYVLPFDCDFVEPIAALLEPPTGNSFITDILLNGVSIFSTAVYIDAGENTSVTAGTDYEFSTTEGSKGDIITITFTLVGGTNTGKGHMTWLTVTPK